MEFSIQHKMDLVSLSWWLVQYGPVKIRDQKASTHLENDNEREKKETSTSSLLILLESASQNFHFISLNFNRIISLAFGCEILSCSMTFGFEINRWIHNSSLSNYCLNFSWLITLHKFELRAHCFGCLPVLISADASFVPFNAHCFKQYRFAANQAVHVCCKASSAGLLNETQFSTHSWLRLRCS